MTIICVFRAVCNGNWEGDSKNRASRLCKSALDWLGRHNLNAKASETNVSALAGGEQANRGNAEVLENLRAQPDFAPLPRTGRIGSGVAMWNLGHRHAGRPISQINDNSAPSRLKSRQRCTDRSRAAENITDDVRAMQSGQHAIAIANRSIDECHVMHAVERRDVGITVQRADF